MGENKIYKIWVVEDDPVFKTSLEDLVELEEQFELVNSVSSIESALKGFTSKPSPDVILEDIELPGMSGIEAIPFYKKQFPEAAVIMLTIFDDDDRVFEAIKAGADGYLLKRSSGDEIIKAIKDVIKGGAPISPAIAKKMMSMLSGGNPSLKESPLTKREHTILKFLVEGYTIDMISAELHISPFTVDTHTKNIYRKLHVHNRSSVVAKAIREGLV